MKRLFKRTAAFCLAFIMAFSVLAASGDIKVTAASLSSAVKSISSKFTGIKKIGGYKYYFVKGKMKTGLKTVKGKKYYFTSSGKALKNKFKTVKGKKYYFTSSSAAKVGILNPVNDITLTKTE